MERLTKRDDFDGMVDLTKQYGEPIAPYNEVMEALNKLAAYEETGLTPEDVERLIPDVNYARARYEEYYQLERDGRLLVLPCKVGTTVYRIVDKCRPGMNDCPFDGGYGIKRCYKNGEYYKYCGAHIDEVAFALSMLDDVGKTVFLSKEEAEKALEGMG